MVTALKFAEAQSDFEGATDKDLRRWWLREGLLAAELEVDRLWGRLVDKMGEGGVTEALSVAAKVNGLTLRKALPDPLPPTLDLLDTCGTAESFETNDTVKLVRDRVYELTGWDVRRIVQHMVDFIEDPRATDPEGEFPS
jgi:hypothetical protein